MYVGPRGVEHKAASIGEHEVKLLLIALRGVLNTRDRRGTLTAANDVWV
ncbi:MAG TPA: hypothetical protein VIJ16_02250 [Gemmatimonadaceae bacterium]